MHFFCFDLFFKLLVIDLSILFFISVIIEGTKSAEWFFVYTSVSAEVISIILLMIPVTWELFALIDRSNRLNGYMNANEFASLWDDEEGGTFKADPSYAMFTWIDGDDFHEA